MNAYHSMTRMFSSEEVKREDIKKRLMEVESALSEKGYDAVNQIVGYLISNDLAYISSYKDSRKKLQEIDRTDIIEELVTYYLESSK